MKSNGHTKRPAAYPATVAQFKRQAEQGFRRANPDAQNITFTWMTGQFDKPRRIKYPTGLEGFTGRAIVTADGYGTVRVTADADRESGIHVGASQINLAELAPKYIANWRRDGDRYVNVPAMWFVVGFLLGAIVIKVFGWA